MRVIGNSSAVIGKRNKSLRQQRGERMWCSRSASSRRVKGRMLNPAVWNRRGEGAFLDEKRGTYEQE